MAEGMVRHRMGVAFIENREIVVRLHSGEALRLPAIEAVVINWLWVRISIRHGWWRGWYVLREPDRASVFMAAWREAALARPGAQGVTQLVGGSLAVEGAEVVLRLSPNGRDQVWTAPLDEVSVDQRGAQLHLFRRAAPWTIVQVPVGHHGSLFHDALLAAKAGRVANAQRPVVPPRATCGRCGAGGQEVGRPCLICAETVTA
jgi:hypothetical protein